MTSWHLDPLIVGTWLSTLVKWWGFWRVEPWRVSTLRVGQCQMKFFLGIPKFQNVKFLQWWLAFIGFVCKPLHISFIQNYHHPNLPSEDVGGPTFRKKKRRGNTVLPFDIVASPPGLLPKVLSWSRWGPLRIGVTLMTSMVLVFLGGKNPWDSHKMMQIETFGWCRLIECLICLVIFDGENIFIIDFWGFSVLEIQSWYGVTRWVAI